MSELCLIAGFPNKNVYFGLPQKYSFIRFRNKVFLTTADKQLALFKLYFLDFRNTDQKNVPTHK